MSWSRKGLWQGLVQLAIITSATRLTFQQSLPMLCESHLIASWPALQAVDQHVRGG